MDQPNGKRVVARIHEGEKAQAVTGEGHSIPPRVLAEHDRSDAGVKGGRSEDVLRLFIGGVEHPLDFAAVWTYSRKDALKAPEVEAVAELKKVFEESERIAAEREKQKQQQAGKKTP